MKILTVFSIRLVLVLATCLFTGTAGAFSTLNDRFTSLTSWDTSVAVDPAGITLSGNAVQIAATGADTFQRQDMKSASSDYSWLSAGGGAVTYLFNITGFPDVANNNFEAHLMLVGNSSGGNYADYNEGNVIYFKVFDYGDAYGAELYFKAGAPSSSIYSGRKAASFYGQASPLGTWGFTLQGTNVAIFGPNGVTNTGTLLATALTAFNQSALIYVGVNPNGAANLGQAAT